MSIDRGMDKEDVVHIYSGIYTTEYSHKREWNNGICGNMGGPRDYHINWSKSDRERQISYNIAHMWNLIFFKGCKWTYLQDRNRLTDIKKQTYGYQRGNMVGRNKLGTWD